MSYIDLQPGLDGWEYDADRISARKLIGADGRAKIQLRVELGLLQMEAGGRPDGVRPRGAASLLEYHKKKLDRYEERNGTTLGFSLGPNDCASLQDEASLYYKRYVALFVLEDFSDVARDTAHNLAILDLCRDYAAEKRDRKRLEVFRPYILMMNARACAHAALEGGEPTSALAHVNRGLVHIWEHFSQLGRPEAFQKADEVKLLDELREEISGTLPEDGMVKKRKALRDAVEAERFEEAAKLRDELKTLKKEPPLLDAPPLEKTVLTPPGGDFSEI